MIHSQSINTDVLIVGAGPAGLAAAIELRRLGVEKVMIIEREAQAGGIPRHCFHGGFGWFDMRRILSGPAYAQKYQHLAERAGVEIAVESTAQCWSGRSSLQITSPAGIKNITAKAILLATGCRERPRAARLVPGSRPRGIYNTGSLQQLVYLKDLKLGNRAIVIGAEHVSYSAVHTLNSSGTRVAAMITEQDQHQSYPLFYWGTRFYYRTPLLTNFEVTNIHGKHRVEAIEITSTKSGKSKQLECDSVIFTGDWIPDHELARKGNILLDNFTRGPAVDPSLRTSNRGIFAAGNLLRGVEKADTAALEGRHVANSIVSYLSTKHWPLSERISIVVNAPLGWISPNVLVPEYSTALPLNHFTFRTRKFLQKATIEVTRNEKLIHSQNFRKLTPNRWYHLDGDWITRLGKNPNSGTIYIDAVEGSVKLANARKIGARK